MRPPAALSTKKYWDEAVKEAKLPRSPEVSRHNVRAIMEFLDGILTGVRGKSLMEVGCAASEWLPFLAGRYGLKVSGLDYSETGCALAAENLRLQGIGYERIICADLFDWKPGDRYDIIISFGVIEHFAAPEKVLKIFAEHLSEGGLMITVVPNLKGVMGTLSRLAVPEVHAMHRVLSAEEMRGFSQAAGLSDLKTSYAGVFSLATIPWSKSRRGFFGRSWPRALALKVLNRLDKFLSLFLNRLRLPASALFSPYIISAAVKSGRPANHD